MKRLTTILLFVTLISCTSEEVLPVIDKIDVYSHAAAEVRNDYPILLYSLFFPHHEEQITDVERITATFFVVDSWSKAVDMTTYDTLSLGWTARVTYKDNKFIKATVTYK